MTCNFYPFHRIELSTITNPEAVRLASKIAADSARQYLQKGSNISIEKREIVKYLLLIHALTPVKLISTQELVNKVQLYQDNGVYTKEQLRQHVGELRDEGAIIAVSMASMDLSC